MARNKGARRGAGPGDTGIIRIVPSNTTVQAPGSATVVGVTVSDPNNGLKEVTSTDGGADPGNTSASWTDKFDFNAALRGTADVDPVAEAVSVPPRTRTQPTPPNPPPAPEIPAPPPAP